MSRRSLWPREHGAYFQLGVPLITALALRTPAPAAMAMSAAAVLAFLANEPLLVLLGHRGLRLREQAGGRARRRLAVLATSAVALGVLGLALAPRPALGMAAIVAVPVAALLALAWRKAQHTAAGELVAAVALTGAASPVLAAGGAPVASALAFWLGWALGFSATVLAVRRVIARHRRPASRRDRGLAVGLGIVTVAAAVLAARMPALRLSGATAAPLAGVAAAVVLAAPSATRLRAIGVVIAIVAVLAGVAAVRVAAS